MIIKQQGSFLSGYTAITEIEGKHAEMMLDVGILVLAAGESYTCAMEGKERAFLLLNGNVEYQFADQIREASRSSVLDEGPWTLHVSAGTNIQIHAREQSELVVERVINPDPFPPVVYTPEGSRSQRFGKGTMQETSTRTVRTIFDAATHETSRMVLGEVINHPGKWSSYPPHAHAHPEVYHYRFFPEQGFGFSQTGDSVFRVTNRDTVTISGGIDHPQVAAPGYAMFYVWMIPHFEGNRFGPDSRVFNDDHTWLMEKDAPIWEMKNQSEKG